MSADRSGRLNPLVEAIGPPVARSPWSAEFAVQSLEILPVGLERGILFWLKPVHAPSLRVALPRAVAPADHVMAVIGWYPLEAIVVHSTSWRLSEGRLVLTYLVVVHPPAELPPQSLVALPVERTAISRGGAKSAPDGIGTAAVLEHAFRHLAWLLADDPAIAQALPDWVGPLAGYQPEPFRALE